MSVISLVIKGLSTALSFSLVVEESRAELLAFPIDFVLTQLSNVSIDSVKMPDPAKDWVNQSVNKKPTVLHRLKRLPYSFT